MDRSTETIVTYAESLRFDQLTSEAIEAARQRLVDAIGCALGGFASPPARIARQYARSISGRPGARVFGDATVTAPDVAAFANTTMLRYLDFNDTYVARGSLHPSDMIPALLAAAEATHASGQDLLLAIVLGYEIACALSAAVSVRERGWDQGVFLGLASAVGVGKLLGLRHAELGNAVSLALVPHVPLRQTRAGELTMWKGCATADAARNGVFAAQLAQLGMTAPPEPFEGKDGLWERATGGFDFSLPSSSGTFAVQASNMKLHPAEYHSQAFLDLVPTIRERVNVERIQSIDIDTYWICYSEIGSEPAKWEPESRETADHSLPYILSTALRDGRIGLDSFDDVRVHDPEVRALMHKIHIRLSKELTDRFPNEIVSRLNVTTSSDGVLALETSYPRGHHRNPATQAELDEKFDALAARVLSDVQGRALRQALASIERCSDVRSLVDALTWSQ